MNPRKWFGALRLSPVLILIVQTALRGQIPLRSVDFSRDAGRQVVVDREPGQSLGHPTTVLLEDGRTIIAVYPKGHGRGAIAGDTHHPSNHRPERGEGCWSRFAICSRPPPPTATGLHGSEHLMTLSWAERGSTGSRAQSRSSSASG